VAVEPRELDVHQDEVRPVRVGHRHSVLPRQRLDYLVAGGREQVTHDAAVVLVILAPHDAPTPQVCALPPTRTGRVKEKVAPCPGLDSTQMRPPCRARMRRAMERPSPVPPFFLVFELSTCWNASKMRAWPSAALPGPGPGAQSRRGARARLPAMRT